MVGGIDQHNPPPDPPDDTASLTAMSRCVVVIVAVCLPFMATFVLIPWIEDLWGVSGVVALLVAYSILILVLLVLGLGWALVKARLCRWNS